MRLPGRSSVEGKILVEIKSVENLSPVHCKQVLTYLKLLKLPPGLLMNFGTPIFKNGMKRIVNNHSDFASLPDLAMISLRMHQAPDLRDPHFAVKRCFSPNRRFPYLENQV